MAKINLLPWREQLRKERQQQFYVMLGAGVALAAIMAFGWHTYEVDRITFQTQRNAYLEKEIVAVEAKIAEIKTLEEEKAKLLARMEVIQNLQRSRPLIVHLFDEMPRRMPEGTYLFAIKQQGNSVSVQGLAQSNTRVSTLMRNIDASNWIGNAQLEKISSRQLKVGETGFALDEFSLKMQQLLRKPDGTIEQPVVEDKKSKKKKG